MLGGAGRLACSGSDEERDRQNDAAKAGDASAFRLAKPTLVNKLAFERGELMLKILVMAVALAGPQQPVSARAGAFCDDIRTLARGAEEQDPFRSLRDREFTPRLGRGHCFFSSAGGYACGHNLARRDETREAYAARIHVCLPGSTRSTDGDDVNHYEVVSSGRFRARVTERGADGGHVGRTINIYFESVDPAVENAASAARTKN